MNRNLTLLILSTLPLLGLSCAGSNPYRQTDESMPGVNDGRYGSDSMEQMAETFAQHLREHRQVLTSPNTVRVLWLGIENKSSEIIEVDRVAEKIKSKLSSGGWAQDIQFVVDRDMRAQLAAEIGDQQGGLFNPATAAKYGRMKGAEFALAGKLYSDFKATDDMRQRDYEMFLSLMKIETGEEWTANKTIRFQQER